MSIRPRLTDAPDHNATPFVKSTLAVEVRELAANLCAIVFLNGKSEGRFAMSERVLRKSSAMPMYRLEVAVTRAVESAWLRRRLGSVELTAAGVYVAKAHLDPPR
jgi:hypothetical protein